MIVAFVASVELAARERKDKLEPPIGLPLPPPLMM